MSVASDIIETAVDFLRPHCHKFDLIVPVPPSTERKVQPVILLANGIGRAFGIPVADSIRTTRSTAPLKDVTDPGERKKLLDGLYSVEAAQTRGRNVLLFDDLFRSGSTMNAITEVLLSEGGAVTVRVLTITKTRSNK
jgi:predicted amidophosphoribosyltransferase